jgi:hypothetical protein
MTPRCPHSAAVACILERVAEPEWADVLTAEDRRGLTPLF